MNMQFDEDGWVQVRVAAQSNKGTRAALILASLALAVALITLWFGVLDVTVTQGVTPIGARHRFPGTLLTDYGIFEQDAEVRDVFYVDTIDEYTSATGVTIDGVLLQDGGATLSGDLGVVNIVATGDVTAVNALLSGDVTAVNATLSGDLGVVNIVATGDITGVNALLSGDVTAVNATLSGDLGVVNIVATGDITGVNGVFSGDLDVVNVVATGDITGVNALLSGDVTAVNATLSGDLGVVNIVATGDITGVNALLSGDVTAVNAALSGDLGVVNIVATGDVTIGGSLVVTGTAKFQSAMEVNANADFDSISTLSIDSDAYYNSTGDVQINDNAVITGTLDVGGEVTYGSNNLYPLGVGLPGFQLGGGRLTITGTVVFTSSAGIPWAGLCTLTELSASYAFCTLDMAQVITGTSTVTLTVYDLTGTQAVSPTLVNWLIIGQPN